MPKDKATLEKWLKKKKETLGKDPYTFSTDEIKEILRAYGTKDLGGPKDLVDQIIQDLFSQRFPPFSL